MTKYYIYDIEVYPNIFTLSIKQHGDDKICVFEISDRSNDIEKLHTYLQVLQRDDSVMVGYNNVDYDYLVLHAILTTQPSYVTNQAIYDKSISIIEEKDKDKKHAMKIWPDKRLIKQLDLIMIHRLNSPGNFVSLKELEVKMRSDNIEDLPYTPGTILSSDEMDNLIRYNIHDVRETEKFFNQSAKKIEFREKLSIQLGKDLTNHDDTKIGTEFFIAELEKHNPNACYIKEGRKKIKRQTIRDTVIVKDVIFPYISFDTPVFKRAKQWFEQQVLTDLDKTLKDANDDKKKTHRLEKSIGDMGIVFGLGGIHACIASQTVVSDELGDIIDLDTSSYYPSLAIANDIYPAHLSSSFCDANQQFKTMRSQYSKGTPENDACKLAPNSAFGNTKSIYSPLYDPQYTMTITINGQLLLCMLAEWVMKIPGLRMLQMNTDGITVKCPREQQCVLKRYVEYWENFTQLELKEVRYSRMFIDNVNNYIAEYEDGKLKHTGRYRYDRNWSQNHDALIVQKAAEANLIHGEDITEFIHKGFVGDGIYDYLLNTKIKKIHRLLYNNKEVQRITRYYISTSGKSLTKIMPPLKGKTDDRHHAINRCKGFTVMVCNDIRDVGKDINFDWYIEETKKLVEPMS